jgi:hypothetical protein
LDYSVDRSSLVHFDPHRLRNVFLASFSHGE